MELFKLLGTIAIDNNSANVAIDQTTGKFEGSEVKITNAIKKIGNAVATYFAVEKIVAFGKEIVNTAASVSAEVSAFEQIMGDYSDEASAKVEQIANAVGMVDSRLTPYMTSMTAKFSGLGYGIEEATDFATRGLALAADASAFWDKSLDESMSHLNSFINGSYEGGEAIGLFANDTQMAMFAVEQGLVSTSAEWSSLDEATKQATRLQYAENMFKMSGATGQAAKEADQYANVQANLTEMWRQFKAEIGEPLLQNVVLPAMEKLIVLVDNASVAFQAASKWVSEHQTTVQILAIAIGTITAAIIAYNIAQNATTIATIAMTAATTAFGTVMAFITSPITLVVAAIGALIAIIVLCVKHWDEIKAKVIEVAQNIAERIEELKENLSVMWTTIMSKALALWESIRSGIQQKVENIKTGVQEKFQNIKDTIEDKITDAKNKVTDIFTNIKDTIEEKINFARDKVKEAIEKIKGFFDFEWKLPDIKLPHFKKIGETELGLPKIGVEWYAKGGVLNKPTIFGMNPATGSAMVGGEAGAEAVAPIDVLQGYVAEAVASQNAGIAEALDRVANILSDIRESLGEDLKNQLETTSLSINNREFGRLVRSVV